MLGIVKNYRTHCPAKVSLQSGRRPNAHINNQQRVDCDKGKKRDTKICVADHRTSTTQAL